MNVQGPDSKVIDFPDSMSKDDVSAAMAKIYPKTDSAPKELSLGRGVWDTGKATAKAVASLPVFAYEQIAHPIQTEKDVLSGIKDIPSTIKKRAVQDAQSVEQDVSDLDQTPGAYQKALRGGRAALTALGLPFDAILGGTLEPTYGKAVGESGVLTAQDAANLPLAGLGSRVIGKPVASGAKVVAKDINENLPKVTPEAKAADIVAKRLLQGQQSTGLTPAQAIAKVQSAQKAGKPMSLIDAGGENVKSLGGYVARQPGQAREIARGFLNKRDEEAATRLTNDVDKYLAKGSVRDTTEALAQARSQQAGPLFEEAYKGGSVAPLEKQYEKEFNEASKRVDEHSAEVSKLLAESNKLKEKALTGYDATAEQRLRGIQFTLTQKEKELAQATTDKADTLAHLQKSRTDATAKTPGAVWTPRIQRLVSNPTVKKGIAAGIKIERNLADAEGRTFDPREYGIIGEKDGELIVGKVPNMRLLASAKEGLDGILSSPEMRDPLTGRLTKEGRSVDMLRRGLLKELREVNPKYAEALDKWAGHSASINAISFGRKLFANKPEDIAAEVKDMSPSEREFARLGAADTIREKILRTGMAGDEAKAVIKSPWMKEQMRPLFTSDKEFNSFVDAVSDEKTMFESKQKVMGGSQTAERTAEDSSNLSLGLRGARGAADLLRGSYWNSLHTLINVKRDLGLKQNEKLNTAIAKLLFDPTADLSQIKLPPEKK